MSPSSLPDPSRAREVFPAQARLSASANQAGNKRSVMQALRQFIATAALAVWRAIANFCVAGWRIFIAWWRKPPLPWLYRAQVLSRTLVGTLGGYYLATSAAALIARGLIGLEMPRNDATLTATMLGFITLAVALMWSFGCASQRRAWLGVGLPAVLLWVGAWWLRTGGVL